MGHRILYIPKRQGWTNSLRADLLFLYEMNETSGTNTWETVQGVNDYASSNKNITSVTNLETGFGGTPFGYIDCGGITSTSGTYTFCVWVKSSSSVDYQYLIDIETGRLILNYALGGKINIFSGGWQNTNYSTPADGIWHYLTFLLNGSTGKADLYVDAVHAGNQVNYTVTNIGGSIRIGQAYNDIAGALNASLDQFAAWERLLTEDEITELYNNGDGKKY